LAEQGVSANAEWEPAIEEFEGVPMALVPVGCFMMGSQVFNEDERPEHEQCFDQPFWIDVYEVTNKQFGEADLECLPWSSGDDQPHICATWFEAVAHCASRGARLPTEAEWEYAARGPDGLIYPWGDDFLYENIIAGRHGNPLTVGSKPAGAAWIGALDMSGNAEEWVSSWYSPYPYDPEDGRESLDNPAGYEYRVQRGGGFLTGDPSWRIRGAYRNWFEPEFTKYTKPGFRCARDY
jgi:iron(II)-dependent oxidoreductase